MKPIVFEAELIAGHKGVLAVIVPFHPEEVWGDKPVRLAGRHHRILKGHPDLPNARLHALMHVIVENQLAGGDSPDAVAALERLVEAGLTRHEAIHAVGSVVAEEMWRIMRNESERFDREHVARALARLQAAGWAKSVPET